MRDKIYMAKSWYQTFFRFTMSKQDRLYFFRVTLSKNIFPYARLIIKTWLFRLTFVTNRLKCYLWRTHLTISNWYNIIWILFRIDKCWDIWLLETRVYTYIYRYATDGQMYHILIVRMYHGTQRSLHMELGLDTCFEVNLVAAVIVTRTFQHDLHNNPWAQQCLRYIDIR